MQFILMLLIHESLLNATAEVNSPILNLESTIKKDSNFYWDYTTQHSTRHHESRTKN